MQRVLKEGGNYFVVSYGKPDNRLIHFQRENLSFDIKHCTLPTKGEENEEEKTHHIYLCKKKSNANELHKKNWKKVEEELKKEYEEELKLLEDEELEFEDLPEGGDDDEDSDKAEVAAT